MDVSSLAKMRVSLLKFDPKVSNFPVLSSRVADSTRATAQSLFSLLQKIRLDCVNVEKDGRRIDFTIFLPSLLFYYINPILLLGILDIRELHDLLLLLR